MKIGKKQGIEGPGAKFSSSKPALNRTKRLLLLLLVVVVTAVLIIWVYQQGQKATQSVTVIMTAQNIYKNQQITEEMLRPYSMLKSEFEKYAITDSNGNKMRRLLLWDERSQLIGYFAAYPLQAEITPDYRCFYKNKVDNSDSVLYSFPGKEIVKLDMSTGDLQTFKTFLEPGDRVTVTAIYTEKESVEVEDSNGFKTNKDVVSYRSEKIFNDILVADLLNESGDSVLDMYQSYKDMSVTQQAYLDSNSAYQESLVPSSLIVALTPEELTQYYYYLSKSGITFRMSLPQRIE